MAIQPPLLLRVTAPFMIQLTHGSQKKSDQPEKPLLTLEGARARAAQPHAAHTRRHQPTSENIRQQYVHYFLGHFYICKARSLNSNLIIETESL